MSEGGTIADPKEADHGIRGGEIIQESGVNGETALVKCGTTKGDFTAKFYRDWSPHGYDRAVTLFQKGFYDHSHFFRVVPKFLVQFGISYSDDKSLIRFGNTPIPDDPKLNPPKKFQRGIMSFAGSGPNSRTSELFISYGTNPGLGIELWETPFGEVIEGMEHVEALHSYGDMPPWGHGPVQPKIRNKPNYIRDEFPLLDKFETCTVQVFKPGDSDSGGADEIGRVSHHAVGSVTREQQRRAREKHNDDPVETEKRQSEAIDEVQKMLGPFENGFQLGMVVVGVVLFLLILAVTRRGRGTEKKAN